MESSYLPVYIVQGIGLIAWLPPIETIQRETF